MMTSKSARKNATKALSLFTEAINKLKTSNNVASKVITKNTSLISKKQQEVDDMDKLVLENNIVINNIEKLLGKEE